MIDLEPTSRQTDDCIDLAAERQPPLTWRLRLRDALRGFKLGVRAHASFFVHFFFSAAVFAAALVLRCSAIEWCSLFAAIALVLITELLNSALEGMRQGLDHAAQAKLRPTLDIGHAAVLLASCVAVLIAVIIFFSRIILLFS